jgi:hypothetical protein
MVISLSRTSAAAEGEADAVDAVEAAATEFASTCTTVLEVALTTDGEAWDAKDETRGMADMIGKMLMMKKQRRIVQEVVEVLRAADEWAPQVAVFLSTL